MLTFTRLTLARQFLLISFFILVTGMLIIGLWVGRQIEIGVTNRTAVVTALYVDSFITPHLKSLVHTGQLEFEDLAALNNLLTETPLGKRIVAFKVWDRDGTVIYSTNPAIIGRQYPVTPALAAAFAGDVHTEISDLSDPENEYERLRWSSLIETYAPVHLEGAGSVIAVSEFYQTTDELVSEIRAAQFRSWLVVGAATLTMYLLLAGLVGRASHTILNQQRDLQEKVIQLKSLLSQNEQLSERVRRAAARTTTLNERFLRRIAADLHDGPGQDLGLALLRIEALAEACGDSEIPVEQGQPVKDDFHIIKSALNSALLDLRAISAGLRLPEVQNLSLSDTAERAVRDYERKSGLTVPLALEDLPADAPLPLKITLYRLLQESLANGYRHAGGTGQRVEISVNDDQLLVKVFDSGQGFDPTSVLGDGHLGLAGMRERVELLGGQFEVLSIYNQGTTVNAHLPLTLPEVEGE